MRWTCFLVCMAYMLGCTPRQGVQATYFSFPSMDSLRHVQLGMPLSQLRRDRPQARAAPYVGLEEFIAGDSVRYHFERGDYASVESSVLPIFRTPNADSPLLAVDVWSFFQSAEDADAVWRDRARQAARNGAATCFSYEQGVRARAMAVKTGDIMIGVLSYAPRSLSSADGTVSFPATLRTFVTRDIEILVPASVSRVPLRCP